RLLVGVALCSACGCAGNAEKMLPVAGRVTLDGQPLKTGTVSFRPDPARGNTSLHHPTGEIDPQGYYVLVTVGQKGAPPGWDKGLVFATETARPGAAAPPVRPRGLVPAPYTDEKTTPLSVEVVAPPAEGAYALKVVK